MSAKKYLSASICPDIMIERSKGKTFGEIAKQYDVTRTSITKLLNKNGFKYDVPARKTPEKMLNYNLTTKQIE